MKKYILIVFLLLPLLMLAGERSATEAAVLAAEFMQQQLSCSPARKAALNQSSYTLAHTRAKINNEAPAFYVFNNAAGGFVVVSGDDRTEDILMYSDEGHLDVEHTNPNLRFWLNRLQEEISAANDQNAFTPAEKKARKLATATAIQPLLKNDQGQSIMWDQTAPYYNLCPLDNDTPSHTGCVATATAMVMYKWRYPKKGTGSHTYTTYSKKMKVSQDFSQVTFDWDNMLPSYYYAYPAATDVQKKAVAELMRCCGVACDMDYTNQGSGSLTDWMANGVEKYLGYTFDKFVTMNSRSEYGGGAVSNNRCHWSAKVSDFITYFDADLAAGRPIVMGGQDTIEGGHEFVCDGRDTYGRYHINWGWEGACNCYCSLTALNPQGTSYSFSSHLDAIVGLRPYKIDTVHVTGISVTPTSAELRINEKVSIVATVLPANATIKSVTWSSLNSDVASVDSDGEVTAHSAGSTTVVATSVDGQKTAQVNITVKNEIMPVRAYKLLTDIHTLCAGDSIIIVTTYNSVPYAMERLIHTTKKCYYFETEMEQIKDSTIILSDASTAMVLALGTDPNGWTLTEKEYGKLGSTALKMMTWNNGVQTWSISVDAQSIATMASTNTSYGQLLMDYNNGSPRYTTYADPTQTILSPQIFVRKKSEPTSIANHNGIHTDNKASKWMIDGRLYIILDGCTYNIQGQLVR